MAGRASGDLNLEKPPYGSGEKTEPNWETIHDLNAACQRIFLILTIIYIVVFLSLGSWIVSDLIGNLQHPTAAWAVWLFMGLVQPLTFYGRKYECYLTGTGLIALSQRFTALFSIISTLSMVITLAIGAEIYVVIAIGQVVALASFIRAHYISKSARPGRYCDSVYGKFSPEIWKIAWPRAWRSSVGQVSLNGTASIATILLAKELPAAEGAKYLLALRFVSLVSQISNAPFYSKLPRLSLLRASGDLPNLIKLSQKGMFFSLHLFVLGVLGLGLLGPAIFSLLKKEVGFPSLELWLMMGAAIAFQRYGSMHLQIYSTTNTIVWHKVGGLSAGIMIILMVIFIPEIGGMALPASLLIGYGLIFAPWCTRLSLTSLGQGFWEYERKIGIPAFVILILGMSFLFWIE